MRFAVLAILLVATPLDAQRVRRDVPVYVAANVSAIAIDTLRYGSPVTLIEYVGDGWFRIAHGDGYGYVHESHLDRTIGSSRNPAPVTVPDSLLTAHFRGEMDARGTTNTTGIAAGVAATQPIVTYILAELDEPPSIAMTLVVGLVMTGATALAVDRYPGNMRYPEASHAAAARRGPEYLRIWEQGYREEHYARRRTATLIGGLIGTALSVLIVQSIEE